MLSIDSIKSIGRYIVIGAFIVVAMLGIPIIFPGKSHPYNGKSAGDKSSMELRG